MGEFIGAVDQGTTSTRFIVFDVHGNIVSHAQKEHGQIYPKPGWVEHDPMEIIANTNEVIGAALARANLTAADLDSVGMTNQRETTLLWDRKTGKPLYSAIVWMDTRADEIVRRFTAQGGQDCFRRQTGLPLATYFSAVKLCWMFENIPGARRKAEAGDVCFGTMDSWLAWHLTRGQHVTDVTNASRTMLMNLSTCAWDDDLLAAFDIPPKCLPRIVASSGDIGRIRTAPLGGVRLTSMLGDQQAALVGQTCFAPGEAKSTYGTGAFMLMHTGAEPVHSKAGLLTTVAYQFGQAKPCYALEGSIAITGALVQWLRDNLRMIDHASEIEQLAISVENNGGVYIVPAFSGLYAPYWKDSARGVIAGLTRYATRAHFARAALEATAFQVCDVAHAMEEDSGIKLSSLKTDGGMVGNNLLMQFQADMLGVPVVRSKIAEITALGAAYAAGLATGFWPGTETLKQNWEAGKSWQPAMAAADRAEHARLWQKAVQRSFNWTED